MLSSIQPLGTIGSVVSLLAKLFINGFFYIDLKYPCFFLVSSLSEHMFSPLVCNSFCVVHPSMIKCVRPWFVIVFCVFHHFLIKCVHPLVFCCCLLYALFVLSGVLISQLSSLLCMTRSCNETFTRYAQNQKIGKPNNIKVLGACKPKCQNRYMFDPWFLIVSVLFFHF